MKANAKDAAPVAASVHKPSPAMFFPDWSSKLHADDSLTSGLREVYRRTLSGFLEFCRQRQAGPSVALARDYVQLARLERAPSPVQLRAERVSKGHWQSKELRRCTRRGHRSAMSLPR